jgi:hypothetical protein
VFEEQAPQMTGAKANSLGECLNVVRIERTLRD